MRSSRPPRKVECVEVGGEPPAIRAPGLYARRHTDCARREGHLAAMGRIRLEWDAERHLLGRRDPDRPDLLAVNRRGDHLVGREELRVGSEPHRYLPAVAAQPAVRHGPATPGVVRVEPTDAGEYDERPVDAVERESDPGVA